MAFKMRGFSGFKRTDGPAKSAQYMSLDELRNSIAIKAFLANPANGKVPNILQFLFK